ncbi:hypothetical protein M407DRAFT_27912 [Tulasnella calospora MUT 4182]|uniref:Retrovirus-related Pol polyprotein from transposon TNT 1-94-like beta-barrel domain-containing protein n=1 Tax=Tulasnella calospora MUT 4182 TaxID=1051891 RepID=A0A0C3QD13_9AGAM|nr:hypothetical protein M407DRAFT_27912 [Tulasnella calospora MUT 4182]
MAAAFSLDAYDIINGSDVRHGTSATLQRDWDKQRNKFMGYLLGTLDQAHRAIIQNITAKDVKAMWETLNNYYQSKDASTRFFATQKMMTVTFRDADHADESPLEFGSRAVDAGNQLKNLLPPESSTAPATAVGTCSTNQSHAITIVITKGTTTTGFSASTLVNEFVVSIIILGLAANEEAKMVRHAIMTGSRTIADTLKELKNTTQQARSNEIGTMTTAALAAKSFRGKMNRRPDRKNWQPHFCKEHGPNKSHDTKDCRFISGQTSGAKVAAEEPPERASITGTSTENANVMEAGPEKAAIAGISKVACPPRLRKCTEVADTIWNVDSEATPHMTPNQHWIRNMQPCRIPIKRANDHTVYATGKRSVVFNPVRLESVVISRVLYVPALANNLLCLPFLTQNYVL